MYRQVNGTRTYSWQDIHLQKLIYSRKTCLHINPWTFRCIMSVCTVASQADWCHLPSRDEFSYLKVNWSQSRVCLLALRQTRRKHLMEVAIIAQQMVLTLRVQASRPGPINRRHIGRLSGGENEGHVLKLRADIIWTVHDFLNEIDIFFKSVIFKISFYYCSLIPQLKWHYIL